MDNEVSPEERSELEGHMERCPSCREEYARLKSVSEELRVWKVEALSEGLENRVLERVSAPSASRRASEGASPRRVLSLRRLAVAAALIVLFAAAVLILHIYSEESTGGPPVPSGKEAVSKSTFPELQTRNKSLWAIDIPGYESHVPRIENRENSTESIWNYRHRMMKWLDEKSMRKGGNNDENIYEA